MIFYFKSVSAKKLLSKPIGFPEELLRTIDYLSVDFS